MSYALHVRLLAIVVILVMLTGASTCDRELVSPVGDPEVIPENYDTITYIPNFRDDLPDFFVLPSRAGLDTTTLSECELRLYRATRNVYCWQTDNYWQHRVCALDFEDDPEDPRPLREATKVYLTAISQFQRWSYQLRNSDEECLMQPEYFEALFGEPTFVTTNLVAEYFTYFYSYTARWRRSACPDIYDNPPNEYTYRSNPQYFQLCPGVMKVQFSLHDSTFQGIAYF